jgi:hypothetical protein
LTARAPLPTAGPELAKQLITTEVSQGLTCVGASFTELGSGGAAASTGSGIQASMTSTGAALSSTGGGTQASSTSTGGGGEYGYTGSLLGCCGCGGRGCLCGYVIKSVTGPDA